MKKLKWELKVTIAVDPTWVEDGFEPTPERIIEELSKALPYAYSHELKVTARTISAPDPKVIRKLQGYE